jgi:Zn-dependent protease
MSFDQNWLVDRLVLLVSLWLSLSIHECAHAWAAWKLGDDTAEKLGRLTLNPLAHLDPIGTVLLPLLGVPFGWAKPVPVQPHRFTRRVTMRTGMMLTAIAGPVSNLVLAAVSIVLLAMLIRFRPGTVETQQALFTLLRTMIFLNVILATFNAIPIPPLDGSRVADALMPEAMRPGWENFCRLGPIALVAVIVLPMATEISLFRWPLAATGYVVQQVVTLLGG